MLKRGLVICLTVGLLILGSFQGSAVSVNDYKNGYEAYGLDTIAGYSTVVRTSKLTPNSTVFFEIIAPDGQKFTLDAQTNANGVAMKELSSYYTKKSGTYMVGVKNDDFASVVTWNEFVVYGGGVAAGKSTLSPSNQVVDYRNDVAVLELGLGDDYGNPVAGHLVYLDAGDGNEVLDSDSVLTDQFGQAVFEVASPVAGAVTYSVYDLTSDSKIDLGAKVLFSSGYDYVFTKPAVVSSTKFAAFGNSAGPVDSFDISSETDAIYAGEPQSLTVKAFDQSGQTVTNFTSKIRFSVSGDNASGVTLPDDYTFTANDQGEHKFSLAFLFQSPGAYELRVTDLDNPDLFTEKELLVIERANQPSEISSKLLQISSPSSGTYSNNTQVITGLANPGQRVKIFDNDIEIGTVVADIEGRFTFTSGVLVDGEHNIYVAVTNDVGTIVDTSDAVTVNVDTTPADVTDFKIDPDGPLSPGAAFSATISVNDSLSQAALMVDGVVFDLAKAQDGSYQGTLVAPIEFGNYTIDAVLVDELGNESRIDDVGTITVGSLLMVDEPVLADVTGLNARAADGRVILNWNPVEGARIYRVYYGESPNELTSAVDTFSSSTTWYVPELENGKTYYFSVLAINSKNAVSEHFSNIVSATPNALVVVTEDLDVVNGTGGSDDLEHMESDVSETGPEMIWLVFFSLVSAYFYLRKQKRCLFE